MLKTRLTLENIPRILLNLIKRLIFLMYKDSSPPNVHAVNIHIFLLVYQLRLLLALTLFPRLICLVSVMLCNFNCEEFIYGTF